LRSERKGITRSVTLGGSKLLQWDVFPFPMSRAPQFHRDTSSTAAPTVYRGEFTVASPGDTWIDTRGWGKGAIWVNGHAIGRFWDIGPQLSNFVPGAWLRKGKNEVIVFDLATPARQTLSGVTAPIWK
jgi:beta-galactosidase